MRQGRAFLCVAFLAGAASTFAVERHALAQPKPQTAAQAEAEQHFQKARALYKAGSYREAIVELEKAHELDPTAKDLVLNLSTVNERLGNIDDALKYMREYAQMDLTPAEKEKTDTAIHRLEGAKKELDAKAEAERQRLLQEQRDQQQNQPPPSTQPESRPHGRIDALTIGAAAVAVAGFTVGTVFGLKALSDKPPASGYVTGTGPGTNGTYADLQDAASHSNSEARVADVAFIVGGVATIGAAVLFFARTRDKNPPPAQGTAAPSNGDAPSDTKPTTSKREPTVKSAWIAPSLGGVVLGGSF